MSEISSNNLSKGLNKDFSPIKQPENTYREAKNFVRLSDSGDYYSFTNEKGTTEYCDLPDTYQVIGRYVLESDMIFISVKTDLSAAQVGVVDSMGVYTVILNDINNELNLDLDHPIDIQGRVLINTNRIIYFVDNKNPIRFLDLDNPPPIGKIDKLTTLVPTSNFPIIDTFEVRDAITTLKAGAYQFVFRYLTDKGNITNVSIPSALTSIGQNSVTSGNQYQGGYSNVNAGKSIVLEISNVDTDYKKLEIIAISYDTDNQIKIYSTAQIDISSDTLEFEYKGVQLYELTIEEILGTTTNYSTAKALEQKDGRLIASNLKENTQIESQLQTIANQITLKYNIEKLGANAYKDGNNNAYKVGYKRGEVYAFGFGVIYKNGAKSLVYHIPAPDTSNIPTPANTATKVLGTYISSLNYPTGQNYPTGNIRYHVMPTYAQEPPYGEVSGSYPSHTITIDGTINALSVEPYFTDIAEWDSIKDQVQGIFIVRRRRDSVQNMSIFSQGIANYMMDNFNPPTPDPENEVTTLSFSGLDFRTYDTPNAKKVLKKTPFLGGIRLGDYLPFNDAGTFTWDGNSSGDDALQTTMQPAQQTFIEPGNSIVTSRYGEPNTFTNGTGYAGTILSELYKDLMVFYSPEVQLLPKIESNTFTMIRKVGYATFEDSGVRFNHSTYDSEDGSGDGESEVLKYPMYFNNYTMTSVETDYREDPIAISKNYYVPRNSYITTDYNVDIDNTKQEEFLFLQTGSDNLYASEEYTYKQFSPRNNYSGDNDATSTNDQLKNVYEVISSNTTQYGSVQGQEYVICKYIPYNQDTLPNLSTYDGTTIYGGDTFIGRMSFTNKSPIQSKAYMFKSANNRWYRPEEQQDGSFGTDFIDLRSNIEFYVESSKNIALRHSLDNGNVYYRFRPIDDALLTNPEVIDDVKSYNNQYDFENNLQLFYSKSDISSITSHYKTRSIWSDETILGELRDRYRDIRPNNFYDLPFNTGEIWDSFVFGNTLYLHTPKTLWKTFFNAIEQQSSTAGQVTLGTGGVFPASLPPQQVITQQGGYAGTISQWGGCNTPFGYIFPDALQGKLFVLSNGNGGPGLEEISMAGLIRYTNDNLSPLDNLYSEYIDNPFKSGDKGLMSTYDFELKRWILVKQHPTNSLTLSYDPITKQFISNHDYRPNVLIARDNRLFGIMNSNTDIKLYEHNKGEYGNFYNTIYSSSISIVVNEGFNTEKDFDNINLIGESSLANKIQIYREIGDTIEVYNDRQHTGITNLVWNNTYNYLVNRNECRVQYLRNNYNLKVPLNSLLSDSNTIFDNDGNLITSNIDQNKLFRDRIRGNYCIIKFTFNNEDDYKLTLNAINTSIRKYYR